MAGSGVCFVCHILCLSGDYMEMSSHQLDHRLGLGVMSTWGSLTSRFLKPGSDRLPNGKCREREESGTQPRGSAGLVRGEDTLRS